jgi:hypothetical protein
MELTPTPPISNYNSFDFLNLNFDCSSYFNKIYKISYIFLWLILLGKYFGADHLFGGNVKTLSKIILASIDNFYRVAYPQCIYKRGMWQEMGHKNILQNKSYKNDKFQVHIHRNCLLVLMHMEFVIFN